jgi:hypothetical protein
MVGTLAAPWPLLPDSIKLKILSADHVYIQPSIDRCNHLIYILYILANKYHAVRVQIYADPQHASCMHIIRLDRPAACRHDDYVHACVRYLLQISAGCRLNIQAQATCT